MQHTSRRTARFSVVIVPRRRKNGLRSMQHLVNPPALKKQVVPQPLNIAKLDRTT